MGKNRISSTLNLTRIMFFVNAAVWLVFGLASLLSRALVDDSLARWVITVLMLINAVVMFWFGIKIASGRAWIFFLAILYIAINAVLSITDQFGWIDALILLLNLIILGLLFITRGQMNRETTLSQEES
jgi:hypothetical protein